MAEAWKEFEKHIARTLFDSERNPLSGGNNRNTDGGVRRGDVLDPTGVLNIECKNHKSPTIDNWVRKAQEEVDKKKAAIIFTHKKRRPYDTSSVTIPLEDFEEIFTEYIAAMEKKYGAGDNDE